MIINGFDFPDNLLYWFSPPSTLLWLKFEKINEEIGFLKIGLPELIVHKLKTIHTLSFRSENLKLRKNGPFCQILTKNQIFKFTSPVSGRFSVNKTVEANPNGLKEQPFETFLISIPEFQKEELQSAGICSSKQLNPIIQNIIRKKIFDECKNCPDLLKSAVRRRI